jgi:hypothetical protein
LRFVEADGRLSVVMEHADKNESQRKTLKEKDIVCLGHLKRAFGLLDRLHLVGTERDKAGNRQLHFDEYCKLVLLYIWNPLIGSVHGLQQAVGLPNVAKALGVKRFSSGSFSESPRVFDPQQLKPILAELAGELEPYPKDPRLGELKTILTLVDGTVLTALARLAKAAVGLDSRYNTSRDGRGMYGWRLHTQFELHTFSPHRMDRTGARNAGDNRENNMLRANLQAGRCYVCDGGYADRSLFDDIVNAKSNYVIRGAENSAFTVLEERLLTQEALDAGVVRDAVVELGGPTNHTVRRVEIQVEPHPRRSRGGFKQTDLIILYTDLLELPAELIALIYLYRYTVELFFRIFKQLLGMRHLLSQREEGIDIQIYCTLIVCVLIQTLSGKKPNKAMRNIVGWYLLGIAGEQDVIDFLNKPDNTGVKLRAKEALWKKLGY